MSKAEQFRKEFLDLLKKYNAEMNVRVYNDYWSSVADGVNFDLDGEVIDDELVTYPTIEFGLFTDKNSS